VRHGDIGLGALIWGFAVQHDPGDPRDENHRRSSVRGNPREWACRAGKLGGEGGRTGGQEGQKKGLPRGAATSPRVAKCALRWAWEG
jgi:hypothetical protein